MDFSCMLGFFFHTTPASGLDDGTPFGKGLLSYFMPSSFLSFLSFLFSHQAVMVVYSLSLVSSLVISPFKNTFKINHNGVNSEDEDPQHGVAEHMILWVRPQFYH